MTASTTISSTRVKPSFLFISAFLVRDFSETHLFALRINVVDILARLRVARRARVRAQAPLLARDWVARDAAQEEKRALVGRGLVGHAFHERLQGWRVAGGVHALLDLAVVRGALVGVDRLANLAQRRAQLLLLAALVRKLGERRRDRGEQRHDRDDDQELDQREAARFHCGCGSRASGFGAGPAAGGRGACGAAGCGRGDSWMLTGGSAPPPPPPRPTSISVPELNSSRRTPGRSMLRITRGVMRSTTSVLLTVSLLFENRRPTMGRRERPGTFWALRRSSSLIRPASTWVSPSRRRSVVFALRVPTW